jgi:hypothetical protein
MIYQNFDLEIICPQGGERLCARVLESPQGDCPFIDLRWPFDADKENAMLSEIYGGLRQRGARSSRASAIQDFGGKLFEAVFSGDIEHLFRSSLDSAAREKKGLRIRLRLPEDSDLHMKPWEFLFDTEGREFLAVREHTPLVRYLPVAQPIPPITVEGPLRVLVALSSPTDHPRLDITREWEILRQALQPSIDAGQLELRCVQGRCTFDNLRDSLRHFGAHIFHFVGHGIPGALILEQESGRGLEMEATHLRSAFPSGALPRLIVLNACSGAITQDVPFSGLAQGFLRQGVPAVVAMQASITDDAALIFTRYFYRDLVEMGAVDASLTEARLRMQGNGHPIEWGTPVLYMRALSGQLFQPAANPLADALAKPMIVPTTTFTEQRRKPREVHIEPSLGERERERKKARESPPKPDTPPRQAAAAPAEHKKRTARTKEAAPPKPEPGEQHVLSPAPLKESMPPPPPEPSAPERAMAAKMAPTVTTPPPPEQALPRPIETEKPAAPTPVEPAIAPPPEAIQAAAAPAPPAKPAEQGGRTKVHVLKPTARPKPELKPAPPTAAPQADLKKRTPPPHLEPILDKRDLQSTVSPPDVFPTFILEPEPEPVTARHSAAPDPAPPPDAEPLPAKARDKPHNKRFLVLGAGAVLLAAGLGVALMPSRETAPAPPAPVTSSVARDLPAPPASADTAPPPPIDNTAPSPSSADTAAPAIVSKAGEEVAQEAAVQTTAPESRPKPSTSSSRKKQSSTKPGPNCRNADISEQSAECLFRNQ